ncbi:MAG: NAD(P)/FAD-dependent oxidoreductase [Acutalibacteraceae bacterium]
MKYVIIGNSAAATGAVEGIRGIDKSSPITIISKEKYHTYSRPLISYYLCGKTDLQRMKYRPDDFYEKNGCTCLFGETAVKIDKDKKAVLLESGKEVEYDRLLVATGSSPFVPPIKGLEKVNKKFTFMSLDDALALETELGSDKKVLIVGAGLIGLKCAEGIKDRVGEITVIDLSERVLSSILDSEGSERVKKHLEAEGLKLILGHTVSEFDESSAVTDSGEKIDFDILVLALGVRPNTSLLTEIGAQAGRGIKTADSMETSIDGIYCAGDCCESHDVSSGQDRILALLPNAYRQGEIAGINMAGGNAAFDRAIPMNAIGFFGLHIITAGTYDGEVFEKSDEKSYKKLFCKDGYLVGYIMVGDVEKAGIYTSLIQNRIPLSDIDFGLIFEKPSLMAFSRKYRNEKLGGRSQ